jgi:PAS domain S-box-containing protein
MLEVINPHLTSNLFIPHGHCYLWKPGLVGLHVVSDALIAIAYFSIPITLIYFVRKREDVPFYWVIGLFGAFIIACGTTHLLDIWTLWYPSYWLSGFLKAITALISVYTAIVLVPLVPKLLALPSPAQLEKANFKLECEIKERKLIEQALRESERRFRAIFNNTFQFTGLMTPDGTLLEANQTALDFGGIQHEDTVGKPFWEARWWTLSAQTQQQLQEAIAFARQGEFVRYEVDIRGAGDKVATIDFSIKPVRNETGDVFLLIPEGRDITEQKKAEQKIKASLDEKEVLLAEIHHRVKNNLHIISNLLYLQSRRSQEQKVCEVLKESRNRVESMALIHESLYRAQDFSEINLPEYIRQLSMNLLNVYQFSNHANSFQIQAEPDIAIKLDQAIPCGLIINELLTNALKHGCRDEQNCKIIVTLNLDSNRNLLLKVSNTGNTLPTEFKLENNQSMGLKLVAILVKQLQGKFEFEKTNPTIFKIQFAI